MIRVISRIKKLAIDTERLRQDAQALLNYLGYHDFDLGILVSTPKTIRKYNRIYRAKDSVTDVLSFPYHTQLQAGERIPVQEPEDKNLGDIIICPEYVQKNLARYNKHDLYPALQMLLAHSIAHVLGYTHESEEEYQLMQKKEKELLDALKPR